MAAVQKRELLVLEAIKADNPGIEGLNISNTWVYDYQQEGNGKVSCFIHGRYGTGMRDRLRVTYNKLDVEVMTRECSKTIPRSAAMSTAGVLAVINDRYGFAMRFDEIEDLPIVNGVIRLEPKPESKLWQGSTAFSFYDPPPKLSDAIIEREYELEVDKFGISIQTYGGLLSYGHDYTKVGGVLDALTQDQVISQATATSLSAALKSVDGVSWGFIPQTKWSLADATVAYVGPTANAPVESHDVVNTGYTDVVILLPADGVELSVQPIPFHYNTYTIVRS